MRRYSRRFRRQFQRFVFTLAGCVREAGRYNPWQLAYAVGAALLGTGLQALSLGGVLTVARSYEGALRSGTQPVVELPYFLPAVPSAYAFVGVVVLLTLSILVLYEAQRATYALSFHFGNQRAADLVTEFPLVAECTAGPAVDVATGTPLALRGEMSQRTMRLSRAARTLLGGAMALMQFLYGVAFLLYIQPILTVLLSLFVLPIMIPVRRFTRAVNDAEKSRRGLAGTAGADMAALMNEAAGRLPRARAHRRALDRRFRQTGIARSSLLVLDRLVNIARSKYAAMGGLALMLAGSIAFFFGIYGAANVSIASVVVYFIALRVAAMSGRQLTSRSARFARFYEPVRHFLHLQEHLRSRAFPVGTALQVSAPRADAAESDRVVLQRGVPVALAGLFPVSPVNLHLLAMFGEPEGRASRGDIAAGMVYAPADPVVEPGVTWRDWLPAQATTDFARLFGEARAQLPAGAAPAADVDPDAPIEPPAPGADGGAAMTELGLLAAWSSAAALVVLPAEGLARLPDDRRREWLHAFADRYVVVYSRLGEALPPLTEESPCVLLDVEGTAVAVARCGWLAGHVAEARQLVELEVADLPGYAGDDDDDED